MLANLTRNIIKLNGSTATRFLLATKTNSLSSQADHINKSLYSLSDEELQMKETGNLIKIKLNYLYYD